MKKPTCGRVLDVGKSSKGSDISLCDSLAYGFESFAETLSFRALIDARCGKPAKDQV